jgi:hypothetical protein
MSTRSYFVGGPAFVTDGSGKTTLVAGMAHLGEADLAAALAASFVTDDDSFPAPAVLATQLLLPALLADADTFPAPSIANTSQVLLPALLNDAVAEVYAAEIDNPPGHGKRRFRPPLVSDSDSIKASAIGASVKPNAVPADDVVYAAANISAARGPGFVASDDVVFSFVTTLFVQPNLMSDSDVVPAADVGWKVFAETTTDVDETYGARAEAWAYVVPDVYGDEESAATYPFRLQALTGGIPVPARAHLTGSLSARRVLRGSITSTVRLKGSMGARLGKRR